MIRTDPELESLSKLTTTPGPGLTSRGKWLVLLAAFLGWMFDGLEQGIFPLVAGPALTNLLGPQFVDVIDKTLHDVRLGAAVKHWQGIIDALFLLGAACGGLAFGWLGDKIGRVRAMSLSILVYSMFTGMCYFVQSPLQLGSLRFVSAVGMGGEWSLGVALVMEVWDARYRPLMAGMIGAAANVGFALIGVVAIRFKVTETSWRWVMLAGAAPAILTFATLMFVPESHRWQESQKKSPSKPIKELFSGQLVPIALLGFLFASVALIGTWGAMQKIPAWVSRELAKGNPQALAFTQVTLAGGAIAGCLIAPFVGAWLGRRVAYFGLCALSLVAAQIMFRCFHAFGPPFLCMVFVVGMTTAAFYGWMPLYLPELFPTRVRATAQGLSYNSGRILAAAGTIWGGSLAGDYARMGRIVSMIYIVGMVVIWLAPETKGRPLPETEEDVLRGWWLAPRRLREA